METSHTLRISQRNSTNLSVTRLPWPHHSNGGAILLRVGVTMLHIGVAMEMLCIATETCTLGLIKIRGTQKRVYVYFNRYFEPKFSNSN
jgi:hypothetical protein